jgi:hypothetical protein
MSHKRGDSVEILEGVHTGELGIITDILESDFEQYEILTLAGLRYYYYGEFTAYLSN